MHFHAIKQNNPLRDNAKDMLLRRTTFDVMMCQESLIYLLYSSQMLAGMFYWNILTNYPYRAAINITGFRGHL